MTVLRWLLVLSAALVALALGACQQGGEGGGGGFGSEVEPARVAIRNSSGVDLAWVAVRAASSNGVRGRVGRVQPVLNGTTQEVGRASDAPQFPRKVVLEWKTGAGEEHDQELELGPVFAKSAKTGDETIVFEIGRGQGVRAYLERGEGH